MTWTPFTSEQVLVAQRVVKWIEVARIGRDNPIWLPTYADIRKSALLERLNSGKEPLDEPPPLSLSCPWYALVEDPEPHYVGSGPSWGPYFSINANPGSILAIAANNAGVDIVNINQAFYAIVEDQTSGDLQKFLVRDCHHKPATSYRFHLWHDNEWKHPTLKDYTGGWFMRNAIFDKKD